MAGKREPATLTGIAKEVGVTPSTVSRVLNSKSDEDARHWASLETVARIRAAAARQNYSPNPQAVGLRKRRSHMIGVVVPRLQDYVLATIYEGIDEAAALLGYATCVTNSLDERDKQETAVETLLSRRVDGLIFGDAHLDGEFLSSVVEHGVKFVLVSRAAGDFPSVTTDDYAGGRLVGQHLYQAGRRNIAILAGQPYASTGLLRTRGAVDALSELGVEVSESNIVHGPFDAEGGRAAAEELFGRGAAPDAIFATNDFAAIGAMGALRDRHLLVPDDVAIVGYNDTPLAAQLPVPMTTIRSPMREMGRRGMRLLQQLLSGEDAQSERLAPELLVRESSRPRVPSTRLPATS